MRNFFEDHAKFSCFLIKNIMRSEKFLVRRVREHFEALQGNSALFFREWKKKKFRCEWFGAKKSNCEKCENASLYLKSGNTRYGDEELRNLSNRHQFMKPRNEGLDSALIYGFYGAKEWWKIYGTRVCDNPSSDLKNKFGAGLFSVHPLIISGFELRN